MKIKYSLLLTGFSVLAAFSASGQSIIAYDNADLSNYAPQPTHNWSPINGGYGYNTWTALGGVSGGGTYMEGVGVNGRQVEGNYSFALYAGGSAGNAYAISRSLSNSLTAGSFSILTRFDLAGNGPNLVNLRAGNNTGSFGLGELLSFGIVNGSTLSYTDGSGLHPLASGESRGSVWDWNISFDAVAGTYSGSVTNLGGGFSSIFNGNLEASATSVGSFAAINSSSGANQNLIFDAFTFTAVPEPSTVAMALSGMAMLFLLLRR